jgi:excisionase family DNA binding protein
MLTVPEAARRTGRHPETIRRWIREGHLRAHKVGTQHLIEPDDLLAITEGRGHRTGETAAGYETDAWGKPAKAVSMNEWLPAIVGRIVRVADPVRIVLFGTRALNAARPDDDYELLVILDDVPDRREAMVEIRRSFADIPASAEILVDSAANVRAGARALTRRALAEGRTVYVRDTVPPGSLLQRLIDTGRATPAANPDTSALPAARPARGGPTATEILLAERREDLR